MLSNEKNPGGEGCHRPQHPDQPQMLRGNQSLRDSLH